MFGEFLGFFRVIVEQITILLFNYIYYATTNKFNLTTFLNHCIFVYHLATLHISVIFESEILKSEMSNLLTPPRCLSSYDDGKENAAHPHMMICRLRQNACI